MTTSTGMEANPETVSVAANLTHPSRHVVSFRSTVHSAVINQASYTVSPSRTRLGAAAEHVQRDHIKLARGMIDDLSASVELLNVLLSSLVLSPPQKADVAPFFPSQAPIRSADALHRAASLPIELTFTPSAIHVRSPLRFSPRSHRSSLISPAHAATDDALVVPYASAGAKSIIGDIASLVAPRFILQHIGVHAALPCEPSAPVASPSTERTVGGDVRHTKLAPWHGRLLQFSVIDATGLPDALLQTETDPTAPTNPAGPGAGGSDSSTSAPPALPSPPRRAARPSIHVDVVVSAQPLAFRFARRGSIPPVVDDTVVAPKTARCRYVLVPQRTESPGPLTVRAGVARWSAGRPTLLDLIRATGGRTCDGDDVAPSLLRGSQEMIRARRVAMIGAHRERSRGCEPAPSHDAASGEQHALQGVQSRPVVCPSGHALTPDLTMSTPEMVKVIAFAPRAACVCSHMRPGAVVAGYIATGGVCGQCPPRSHHALYAASEIVTRAGALALSVGSNNQCSCPQSSWRDCGVSVHVGPEAAVVVRHDHLSDLATKAVSVCSLLSGLQPELFSSRRILRIELTSDRAAAISGVASSPSGIRTRCVTKRVS